MEQTTSRLRKTFHFPTDGDSDDNLPDALDEEEQETLIRTLQTTNHTLNKTYTRILLLLPLTSILPYTLTLTNPHTTLLSLLSITSLLSTAYLLYTLPPATTALPFLDNLHSKSTPKSVSTSTPKLKHYGRGGDNGPIETYLPYLNIALCTVLIGLGAVVGRKHEGIVWWGFGWLPAIAQAVVVLAKWIMGSVDPEGELEGLRYGFKGA